MLTLYTDNSIYQRKDLDIRRDNDWEFDEWLSSPDFFIDEKIKALVRDIDGTECSDDGLIKNRSGRDISLDNLSTGCKTAINIYCNPNVVFDTIECGNNAKIEILKLPHGNAVMLYEPYVDDDMEVNIRLISDKEYICHTFLDCACYWKGGW